MTRYAVKAKVEGEAVIVVDAANPAEAARLVKEGDFSLLRVWLERLEAPSLIEIVEDK